MYSNNILNFKESTTILNACTKKSGNLLKAPRTLTGNGFPDVRRLGAGESSYIPDLYRGGVVGCAFN